jgi:hypothetical protein
VARTFDNAIAERLAAGNLDSSEQAFLVRWTQALDDDVWKRNSVTNRIVTEALEQLRIAKGGKARVDAHNKKMEAEQDKLLALADAAKRIAEVYREASKRREVIIVLELKNSEAPELSFDELALVHEDDAVRLAAMAKNKYQIPTKRQGGKSWHRLQFVRGMCTVMIWTHPHEDTVDKIDDADSEVVAAITNLAFETDDLTADDVSVAYNNPTTRAGRRGKYTRQKKRHECICPLPRS